MKRRFLVGMGLAGAALLSVPAAVIAQAPPEPPATFHGDVTGAEVGQRVIAIVFNGGSGTACGAGEVIEFEGSEVYVVDVAGNSQIPGCGSAGRTIRFYFPGTGANPGQFATQTATWSGAGVETQDLTVSGTELTLKRALPLVASDGVY